MANRTLRTIDEIVLFFQNHVAEQIESLLGEMKPIERRQSLSFHRRLQVADTSRSQDNVAKEQGQKNHGSSREN